MKNNWTRTDLTGHQWFTGKYCHLFGHITDNMLSDTKGVYIDATNGIVGISYFNDWGGATRPRIFCNEDDFRIDE